MQAPRIRPHRRIRPHGSPSAEANNISELNESKSWLYRPAIRRWSGIIGVTALLALLVAFLVARINGTHVAAFSVGAVLLACMLGGAWWGVRRGHVRLAIWTTFLCSVVLVALSTISVPEILPGSLLLAALPIVVAGRFVPRRVFVGAMTVCIGSILVVVWFVWYPHLQPESVRPLMLTLLLAIDTVIGLCLLAMISWQSQSYLERALQDSRKNEAALTQVRDTLAARAGQLALANEIAGTVSATLSVPDLLETILTVLRHAIPCDRISIALLDATNDTMVLRAVYDPANTPGGAIGAQFPFDPALFASSDGLPALILESDLRASGGPLRDELVLADLRSRISVPIAVADAPLGMVTLARRTPDGFHPDECALLQWIAPHLAVALRNAQLYQERQDALDTLAHTQEQLIRHERLRAMGELASGVAHDFNNLLTIIIGTTDLTLLDVTEPALVHDLELVRKAASDGAVIVRRLQSFTRQQRSEPNTLIELHQIAADAIALTRPYWRDTAQHRGVTIAIDERLTPVAPVRGVAAELREALTNLLINAVQAMPRDGVVTVTTLETADTVGVAVRDTGIGIPPEMHERIFDPFFTSKGPQGSGLGLAVVAGIVERSGGRVEVISSPGQGSTFTIWLPRANAVEDRDAPPAAQPLLQGRALVIDDDPAVRVVLTRLLQVWGMQVMSVASGAAALDQLDQGHFDLVFSDLGMADMNGWEVLGAVKARDTQLVTFLVTGWGDQIEVRQANRQGADYIVAKPFKAHELRPLVQAALERRAANTSGVGGQNS
jgi:signal transduction histidine kinase/CheY-like chemotaxis protein